MADGKGLWRNRDYVGWLVGETLSSFGTSLSTFAYPLLILFSTNSASRTGIVAAAANIGSLGTILIGGALADRYSRRMILIIGPLVQAAVVASVGFAVLAGHVVLLHVALAGFVDGSVVGMTSGADTAALRRLVPAEDFAVASSQRFGRDMAVRVGAPPLGGVLFAASRALPFLVDAGTYFASVIGVLAIKRPLGPEPVEREEREPLLVSVRSGIRFMLANPYLRFVGVWAAGMNLLGGGLMLLVIFLLRAHGGSPEVIGGTQAVGSVGGIVGAIICGRVIKRFAGRSLVITLSWTLAGAALIMALVPNVWGIAAALALVSVGAVPLNVVLQTYEMQIIPDAMVARVTTTLDLLANGLRWLAPLAVGGLTEATSARTAAFVWGGVFVVPAVLVIFNKSLHVLNRPIEDVAASA